MAPPFLSKLAGVLLLVLIGTQAARAQSASRPALQAPAPSASANEACLVELRALRKVLQSIADTAQAAPTVALADENANLVDFMIGKLGSPQLHLGPEWLATFQDLRYLATLRKASSGQPPLALLRQELLLKLKRTGNGGGSLTQGATFQELGNVLVSLDASPTYQPKYRVHYVRGSERQLPQHTFTTLCKSGTGGCQTQLTPCYYLFWAVDAVSNRVCSDTVAIRLDAGASKPVGLQLRHP